MVPVDHELKVVFLVWNWIRCIVMVIVHFKLCLGCSVPVYEKNHNRALWISGKPIGSSQRCGRESLAAEATWGCLRKPLGTIIRCEDWYHSSKKTKEGKDPTRDSHCCAEDLGKEVSCFFYFSRVFSNRRSLWMSTNTIFFPNTCFVPPLCWLNLGWRVWSMIFLQWRLRLWRTVSGTALTWWPGSIFR